MSEEASPSLLDRLRSDACAQAGAAYLVYGLVYLLAATLELTPERRVDNWWIWFVGGGVLVVVLPPLIWRGVPIPPRWARHSSPRRFAPVPRKRAPLCELRTPCRQALPSPKMPVF